MTNPVLPLSDAFDTPDEAAWIAAVEKTLKGRGVETLVTRDVDGTEIHPLYRETQWPSSTDPLGQPGHAPYIRGAEAVRDPYLPWDIRQTFTHPDPAVTNGEILRDLERGVTSIELKIDSSGQNGIAISTGAELASVLKGVDANIATVALDRLGDTGTRAAGLLGQWGQGQQDQRTQKFAFNIDVLGSLARSGLVEGGLDHAFAEASDLIASLADMYPVSSGLRIDARMVHEAGAAPAEELGVLIASAVDTLRRLDAAGLPPDQAVQQMMFCIAVGANYGVEIAKMRAARRLWARCLDALGLAATPMRLQTMSSARMLTRYDTWTNILRNSAACFAGGVGGADIVTIRAFNEALGVPEELGRRVARNTQIIAQEESHLGKVADAPGGAWFTETLADDLAERAWQVFQQVECDGGYAESLMADKIQGRIAETRSKRVKAIARRKTPVTGVSEFPALDDVTAPIAAVAWKGDQTTMSTEGLEALRTDYTEPEGEAAHAEPFWPIRLAEAFERLRNHAEAQLKRTGSRPNVFLATLGPAAEHTARADFARNLFAAGGIDTKAAPVPPRTPAELAAAYQASGCQLAVLCGSNQRYAVEAAPAAAALKNAGAQRIYLAGKHEADGVDSQIFMGVDVIDTLELAHAELGINQ
ncbi:MAG: methylmalonyl-CoA mutase family protein [Pseudomonadota bacterium]